MGPLEWASLAVSTLAVSTLFLVGGITIDILAWRGKVGKDEPNIVLHLSTFAIIGSGLSGLISTLAAVSAT